ncbi:MAG TPA: alpha/beta fold hydrolase [Chitinophagaceae bacterium]|nr:alpha/beta fold hydrolase [Chitinophagaceae bacterium]
MKIKNFLPAIADPGLWLRGIARETWGKGIVLLLACGCLGLGSGKAQERPDSVAREFLVLNRGGQFDQASAMFAPSLRNQVSAAMLEQVWKGLVSAYGPDSGIQGMVSRPYDTLMVEMVTCHFSKANLTLNVVVNRKGDLVGYTVARVRLLDAGYTAEASRFAQRPDTLHTPTGDIFGTLMVPSGHGSGAVALILAGSGAVDRDGNSLPGEHSDVYFLLAEGLAGEGIASLRFDKRGIGQSAPAMQDERKVSLENYVSDAAGWINKLRAANRFSTLIVIGHSEGSLIGMMAARLAGANGFVSISGMGVPMDSILMVQLKDKLNDTLYAESLKILKMLRAGKKVSDVPQPLLPLFTPAIQPYLISEIRVSPTREIARLRIPVLVIQGKNDVQVTEGDARKLAAASWHGKLLLMDHMTHMLKDAGPTYLENMKTYQDASLPLDSALVPAIVAYSRELRDRD